MFELEVHGGLGRKGTWTRSGQTLTTPLVLFVPTRTHPAPTFAEALFVSDRTEDPRLQIRVSGSFFGPREARHPDDVPPSKGTPLSMTDLEFPEERPAGDLAIVTAEADLSRAANAEVVFLANGPQFERSPREFVAAIRRVKESLGPARVLAVTGLATPSNVPILVYAGIDVIDSSRMVLDRARGLFHTSDGSIEMEEAEPAACGCPACVAGGDLPGHNDFALHRAVLLVRNHLAHGRLRELVERRLANAPWNTAVVRHLDLRGYDLVEPYTPVAGREVLAYASESLHRPEVVRFRRRIMERYAKPPSARVLLLLPCSARKPYSASRSHRRFREAIQACKNPSVVHEVIVTSPLGLIPRELERFYPAGDAGGDAHRTRPAVPHFGRRRDPLEGQRLLGRHRGLPSRRQYLRRRSARCGPGNPSGRRGRGAARRRGAGRRDRPPQLPRDEGFRSRRGGPCPPRPRSISIGLSRGLHFPARWRPFRTWRRRASTGSSSFS